MKCSTLPAPTASSFTRWISALLMMIAFGPISATAMDTAARVAVPGHLIAMPQAVASSTPAPESLTLTVTLKRDDEAGFRAYLADIYDPQSPNFHRFLTQSDIAQRFGPSQAAYDRVSAYLGGSGMNAVVASANRLTLTVSGARADVERTFGLHVGAYRIADRDFYANDRDPTFPADIADSVQAVAGLSNLAQPRELVFKAPPPYYQCPSNQDASYCDLYGPLCAIYAGARSTGEFLQEIGNSVNGMGVRDYVKSYDGYNKNVQTYYENCLNNNFPSNNVVSKSLSAGVPWSSIDGGGQTVGIVAFANYQRSDVVNYLSMIGAPAAEIANLSDVTIGGGAYVSAGEDETLLDIDTVMSLAPAAHVVVYNSTFPGGNQSFQTVFNKMLSDGLVTVISNSWAYCEDQTSLADVQSIDSVLQSAAMAGVSVLSGSGDTGSTCLDGGANTVAVPADSPNITAVGGTSLASGAGGVYKGETWWNGLADVPPTGQGGFGVSRFFARPAYQSGFTTSSARSVPDLSAMADPKNGLSICQADAGGCPNGSTYGGTSMSTPMWAAFTALLNQSHGSNFGFVNAAFYAASNSGGFHTPASMGSDFAHVGIGSPNLNVLALHINGQTVGTPNANTSGVLPLAPPIAPHTDPNGIAADGTTKGFIVVTLRDANGNVVPNKSVTLTANSGNHATITPMSATTSVNDGSIQFAITDTVPETLTFTATDTTDGVTLTAHPALPFVGPAPASSGVSSAPSNQPADGVSASVVTVTILDSLNRPIPNKKILLAQSGTSIIVSENPALTDASGEALFSVVDTAQETPTYTATDLTDDDLPLVGFAAVTFTGGAACGSGATPIAGDGYAISTYASGFPVHNGGSYGGITLDICLGAGGIAFDDADNLFVSDFVTGFVYKLPMGGGVASDLNKLPTQVGVSLGSLSFGGDGNLYGIRLATTGDFTTGAVVKINQSSGAATTAASNLKCPFYMATDPLSGDLFVSDGCFGDTSESADIIRVSNLGTTPTVSTYATSTSFPNGGLSFAADGTLYACYGYNNQFGNGIDVIGKTSGAQPASVTPLGIGCDFSSLPLGSNPTGGAGVVLAATPNQGSGPYSLSAFDLTTTPPQFSGVTPVQKSLGGQKIIGPDQCAYFANGTAIYRLTNADGSCPLTGLALNPSIVVVPDSPPATAPQSTQQRFDVTFPHTTMPTGTPVSWSVRGANVLNNRSFVVGGGASITYAGANVGVDKLVAFATIDGNIVQSNEVAVTWTSGKHTSLLSLNTQSSGNLGSSVTAAATLLDQSVMPSVPIVGAAVQFTFTGQTCSASTDANGRAQCTLPIAALAECTLSANYAGDANHASTSASNLVVVTDYDVLFTNGFEDSVPGGSCTP